MSSLVTYVLQVSLTLLAFGAIAAALVRFGRKPGRRRAGPLELLDRLHLEGRRVVYLVRAGERVLVVGGSEAGLTRLGELGPHTLPSPMLQAPVLQGPISAPDDAPGTVRGPQPEECAETRGGAEPGIRIAGGAPSR